MTHRYKGVVIRPPQSLFEHTREIHLTCEYSFANRFGWKKIAKLITSVWDTAVTKVGIADGSQVSLSVVDMSLPTSICPYRILSFAVAQPQLVFKVTYAPRPQYASVPLRLVKLPNDAFFKVDTTIYDEDDTIEADVVIK